MALSSNRGGVTGGGGRHTGTGGDVGGEKSGLNVDNCTPGDVVVGVQAAPATGTSAAPPPPPGSGGGGGKHSGTLSSLGDASGVAILLGNHAKFGLAERCCYHFDLIETLTSLPIGRVHQARIRRRDRGMSLSSHDGGEGSSGGAEDGNVGGSTPEGTTSPGNVEPKDAVATTPPAPSANAKSSSNPTENGAPKSHCFCGVVSLLECVAGGWGGGVQPPDRTTKRALRSKHREFNTRAQLAWGRRGTKASAGGGSRRRGKPGERIGGGGSGAGEGASGGGVGGGGALATRRCHQPRHLPLPLSPNTRVSFAYELNSMAILVDASAGLTSTYGMNACELGGFGEERRGDDAAPPTDDGCCVPLDRLGPLLRRYLRGLVRPIDVPPVAVSGLGVAFGRWTPNLAVTVVAVYPPTSKGDRTSAGLLVRDFRVTDESSAGELVGRIEKWALGEVESVIAERLCGERDFLGDGVAGRKRGNNGSNGNGRGGGGDGAAAARGHHTATTMAMSPLASYPLPARQNLGTARTRAKSRMKDVLAAGDAALSTLPPEGRPLLVVATDCRDVHCGGAFDALSETARSDVPLTVLDLSSSSSLSERDLTEKAGKRQKSQQHDSFEGESIMGTVFSPFSLSVSDDSQSLRDACSLSGGVFLTSALLESYVGATAGSQGPPPLPLRGDYHFGFKKRSVKPNALQWCTLFTLSPFTPSGSSSSLLTSRGGAPPGGALAPGGFGSALASGSFGVALASGSFSGGLLSGGYLRSYSRGSSVESAAARQVLGKSPAAEIPNLPLASSSSSSNVYDTGRTRALNAGLDVSASQERIAFAKYNIQPIRIKSLLMTRVLEGYHAKRYGHNTQDHDKVSVHLVLRLADCGVVLHYEASFVASPYHMPMVGQAHIKLELSGDDTDFIQLVKKVFVSSNHSGGAPMEGVAMHHQGRRVSASSRAAADRICKLLRWTRKEDHLESYLCLPGWGGVNHFAARSSFLGRLESLSPLQRYRHFRSEVFEIVTIGPNFYEKSESLFSDLMEQNKGEEEMFQIIVSWSTEIISDRSMYLKELIPAQEDDLAYYCVVRIVQSPSLARLFSITVDFHGEINAEQRLAVLFSLKENLKGSSCIILLEKCISSNVAIRPASSSCPWSPRWNEYFLHHKSWELLQEGGVLPLITKRRNKIGGFVILMQDDERAIFAKFAKSQKEERFPSLLYSVVIYQVLSRADGIFVDIHMESSRSTFYPFHSKHKSTTFSSIHEQVKRRDKDCARNVRSRTNLMTALDRSIVRPNLASFHPNGANQAEDVMRLIKLATCTKRKLRFFNGSSSANDLLCHMTKDYITSDSFQTQAAKLTIDENQVILRYSGSWFIMRVDWYVLSLVCLELKDQVHCEEGRTQCFRHLSFFTVGFIDLYQSDDDLNYNALNLDDTSAGGNEHCGESEIATEIESAHAANFARACYLALRDTLAPITSLQADEVEYALSSCSFTEVLRTFVSVEDLSAHLSSHEQTMTGTKLGAVIGTLLQVVPGSNDEIFFYHGAEIACLDELTTNNTPDDVHDDFIADDVESFSVEQTVEEGETCFPHRPPPDSDNPPLFFRFTLDQKLVSFNEILTLKKSAMLAAQVSVFIQGKKLPPSHAAVVSKLQNALNSFASEQTLEKFRYLGRSLTENDFKVVMGNVTKTKHHSLVMPLEFFISRSSLLVPADNPTGSNENDLDHGFSILMEELDRAAFTVRASHESFLVLDDSASRVVLPYWSFIQVRKPRGCIIVRVHHPLGEAAAQEQAKVTQKLVKSICDKTNQLLLLDSLYSTKNASDLLIPEEEEPTEDKREANSTATYSCPVQHRTAIPLHRRCAPQQAILEVETTILQNFVISNRRSIFVYKDESSSIFYMKLNWNKISDAEDTEQNPHIIELLVHGCDKPGPLITDQLVSLLRRKLLTLTLDALSNLLKKNPFFNLLSSDLAFIKTFSNASNASREVDHSSTLPDCTRTYVLPPHVQDPLILLLMFRQNICGSTFIQHLHHESCSDESDAIQIDEDQGDIGTISFSKLPDFQFYFNSSPSQLDPNYQAMVTLTGKGREYARQAGSGIAIIEVNLQHGNNSKCQIHVGKKADAMNRKLRVSKSDISLCADESAKHHDQFSIIVQITNTTVDIDVIHKWVALSLSQVLAAWSIERHLESARLGLLYIEKKECAQNEMINTMSKFTSFNEALPGLQALEDMVTVASGLPHPAIASVENKSSLKATVLASLTLELLEAIISLVFHKRKIVEGIDIIRYTGKGGASRVDITKDSTNSTRVQISGKGKVLKDKPTDSPEYCVVFGLSESQKSLVDVSQHLFFKQVNVQISTQQETSAFSQALSRMKNAKPSLFQRHLVFILKVSRSNRTLMTYNANPQIKTKMELVFNDIEQEAAKADGKCRASLQSRCIPHISFSPNDSVFNEAPIEKKPTKDETSKKPANDETVVKTGPTRRVPRPKAMLVPKLIGKSVEGAAMQAMAANRLRARSRPSIAQRTLSSAGKKKVSAAPQREKTKEKIVPRERRTAGPQKKNRESTKDATSIIRSILPSASLLKTYKAFLSIIKEGSESFYLQARLNQFALQHMWRMFLMSSKEKTPALIHTRLISTCYGNFIGTGSIQQLQCDGDTPSAKLSFVEHLTNHWGVKNISPMTGSDKYSRSPLPQFLYLKKDLLSGSSRRAVSLMEISMPWDSLQNSSIFCYKVWLVSSIDKTKIDPFSRKPFSSLGGIEREAAVIEAVALDFSEQLNLEQELFHFACLRVTRMARGARLDEKNPTTLCLLKSVMSRYCMETQAKLPFPGYRLQRRFLSLSTFLEGPLLESCKKEALVEYLSHHSTLTCNGSDDDICFAGKLKVEGFLVYYFMAWHESVELALDVFALCVTKGQCVDAYITKKGARYAERIADVVIYSAMTTVQEIIVKASNNIRKMHLWKFFGENYSPSLAKGAALMDRITELRTHSHHLDLTLFDSRLKTLLWEELDGLKLSWQDVLNAITHSSSFAHSIAYEEIEASNYLVYYKEEDMFLDLVLDKRGRVQEARILAREQFTCDDYSNSLENYFVRCAVQKFTLFLLQWIWVDCETS